MTLSPVLRSELARAFPDQPRLVAAFEEQFEVVRSVADSPLSLADATTALNDGTFVVLSANEALTNERILTAGAGVALSADAGTITISVEAPVVSGGHAVTFNAFGATNLSLPLSGVLATRAGAETLSSKTLQAPKFSGLGNYANDAAAAAGGVPMGGAYLNGSVFMVRVT